MKNTHRVLALCLFLVPHFAFAALGEMTDSINNERLAIHSDEIRSKNVGKFVIHEIQNQAIKIDEYATPDGRIFALVWKGMSSPDLKPLLGPYFDDFKAALDKASSTVRRFRAPFRTIHGARVVVERWGRPRHLNGRLYALELFPSGVTPNDIR